MAFHINLREVKDDRRKAAPAFFEGCSLVFKDEKPSILCELFDLVKLEIDLTCSICLVSACILFDAIGYLIGCADMNIRSFY